MKRLAYIVMLLLMQSLMTNVLAGERTKEEMRMAALNALSKSNNARGKTVTARTSDLKEYVTMDKLSVIGSDNLGFAVVTSDDRFDEVIGCSMSNFSEEMPCGFKWWMETAEKVMENTKGQTAITRSKIRSKSPKSNVDPLMTTKWGQTNPFNALLNYTINGNSYTFITGCVATAMAQVMKYHRYPEKSTGSIEFVVWHYLAKMSHNFGATYDYDKMLDEYNYQIWGSLDANAKAVATLMQDCGMAVKMNYGTEEQGSGASSSEIPIGLKTYFAYSDETKLYTRSDYTKTEWMQMIYNELSAGRPIIYSGQDKTDPDNPSGHAFVLHGYNSSGLVYVNWGWKGYLDGYFDIDLLKPDTESYSSDQDMVFAVPGNGQTIVTNQYDLSISASGSGSVSYNGNTIRSKTSTYTLDEGSSATLTFTPDDGYQIKSVTINNVDVTSQVYNNSYTISSISTNTAVSVVFEAIPVTTYSLSISATGNGSVSYNGNTIRSKTSTYNITEGSSATLTFTPDDGYLIKSISVNDVDVTSQVYNYSYTISNISKNTTVSVIFEAESPSNYTLTIIASGSGSVSYSGNIIKNQTSAYSIDKGSSVTLTFTPDDGNKIHSVTVDNVNVTSQVSDNKYTLNNIASNTTLTVVFATYTINPSDYNSLAEFEVDGVRYKPTKHGVDEVDVTSKTGGYSGSITIPSVVVNNGLPYRVKRIGTSAFKDCSDLQEVKMSDGILEIGVSAFNGCSSLTSIILPNSILEINTYAFYGCSALTDIILPNGITTITSGMFGYCNNLQNIIIPTGVTSIGDNVFSNCKSLTTIAIPNSVTSIGVEAFWYCDNLQDVVLSDNIASLPKNVFSGCKNLKKINIPQNVVSIGESAFSGCNLQLITIPANVNTIGEYAFSGNKNLKDVFCLVQNPPLLDYSLNINSKATIYVYQEALEAYQSADYWKDFKIVGLSSEGMEYYVKNGYSEGINDYLSCHITGITNTKVLNDIAKTYYLSVTNRQSEAIAITCVVAKDPITEDQLGIIEDESNLGELKGGETKEFSMKINKDIDPIFDIYYTNNGKLCLLNTSATDAEQFNLTIQTSENGVVSCNGLQSSEGTTITLKMSEGSSCTLKMSPNFGYRVKSVTVNGTDVTSQVSDNQLIISSISSNTNVAVEFEKNPYESTVTFEVDGVRYRSKNSVDEVDVISKSEGYSGDITIPGTVTYNGLLYRVTGIYAQAFSGCVNLQGITIPASVTSIGRWAFDGCSNLQGITIPTSVTLIGGSAFSGCKSLTKIVIPNSVTSMEAHIFNECDNLQDVVLSDNIMALPEGVFNKCKNLKEIYIPAVIVTIGDGAFYGCESLTTITIPNSVMSIGTNAFYGCVNLQEVSLPETITSLPEGIFGNCIRLKDIYIPENVVSIGNNAFLLCHLQSIIIPVSVKTIGTRAYSLNNNFTDVCCLAQTPPSLADNTNFTNATIYVYQQALEAYKSADYWKDYKIVGLSNEDMEEICKKGFHYSEGINSYLNCGITSMSSSGYTVGSTSYITKVIAMFFTNNHSDAITLTRVVAKDPTTGEQLAFLDDESILGELKGNETKEFSMTIFRDADPVYEIYYSYNGKPCLLNTNATDIRQFDLSIQSIGNGTVTCNDQTANDNLISQKINKGSSCTLMITPDKGYRVMSVTVNDIDVTSSVSKNQYTIVNITSNTSVVVTFIKEQTKYSLIYMVDGEVYKTYTLQEGESITPENEPTKYGYKFSGWSDIPSEMPDHDVTVTGSFEKFYDVADIVSLVNIVMGIKVAEENDFIVYDLNNDDDFDIGDMVLVIKEIIRNMNSRMMARAETRTADPYVDLSRFTAAQFMLNVPAGCPIADIRLTGSNQSTHDVVWQQTDTGEYAVVIYSKNNQKLSSEKGNIIDVIFAEGNCSDVSISNVVLATPEGERVWLNSLPANAMPTGISGLENTETFDIYDMTGRKVRSQCHSLEGIASGVYIINGKKTVIK